MTKDEPMIWIIGNKGMLGRELSRTLQEVGIPFTGTDKEVSILEPDVLREYAIQKKPTWIINCSAYTAVDKAEEEKDTAYAINSLGVGNVATLASELDITLVHISTDYVFDGTSDIPLSEDEHTNPVSVYGLSKLAGEEKIRKICTKYYIIRTSWLYGQFGSNFVYTMIKLMNKLNSLKVVNDQIGSPTWTGDITELIQTMIKSDSKAYGTCHFSGEGECSWFEFAGEIYNLGRERGLITSGCTLVPCKSEEFPTQAKRPAYSLLSKEKVKNTFSFNVSGWQDSINNFMQVLTDLNSRVSNWIEHADYDLDTAKAMHNSGRYLYVLITCQQNLEKLLKSIYEFRCLKVPRIHDLTRLVWNLNLEYNQEYVQLFKDLSYYYIASRYSERIRDLSSDITISRSEDIIKKTEEVSIWLKSMILFL